MLSKESLLLIIIILLLLSILVNTIYLGYYIVLNAYRLNNIEQLLVDNKELMKLVVLKIDDIYRKLN